jgi:DNA-binding CsgD family transcriptional regulator
MRAGLRTVLSEPAVQLYEDLVVSGGRSLVDEPDLPGSAAARELIDKGFARERHVGTPQLVPVEPARAVDNAILTQQRHILEQYQAMLRLRDEMQQLQRAYLSAPNSVDEPHDLIRVVTDRAEIGALSVELCLSARKAVVSLETAHFTRPPDPRSARTLPVEVVERGVTFRNIYSRAVLELPGADEMLRASVAAGWQCRVYPDMPMKMVVVDERAALLPLGPTGMEGAVLVTAPVVVSALRMYFELLWLRSVPVDNRSLKLTAEQDKVLRLLLTGMTDGAIARHLGISDRTVRRHVGALLELLGAGSRVSLAVTAVREGWVD